VSSLRLFLPHPPVVLPARVIVTLIEDTTHHLASAAAAAVTLAGPASQPVPCRLLYHPPYWSVAAATVWSTDSLRSIRLASAPSRSADLAQRPVSTYTRLLHFTFQWPPHQ